MRIRFTLFYAAGNLFAFLLLFLFDYICNPYPRAAAAAASTAFTFVAAYSIFSLCFVFFVASFIFIRSEGVHLFGIVLVWLLSGVMCLIAWNGFWGTTATVLAARLLPIPLSYSLGVILVSRRKTDEPVSQ